MYVCKLVALTKTINSIEGRKKCNFWNMEFTCTTIKMILEACKRFIVCYYFENKKKELLQIVKQLRQTCMATDWFFLIHAISMLSIFILAKQSTDSAITLRLLGITVEIIILIFFCCWYRDEISSHQFPNNS